MEMGSGSLLDSMKLSTLFHKGTDLSDIERAHVHSIYFLDVWKSSKSTHKKKLRQWKIVDSKYSQSINLLIGKNLEC
jgi:hypothetical protein